jgi:septal ring factor EnvC (AmiA/AmiB activator)
VLAGVLLEALLSGAAMQTPAQGHRGATPGPDNVDMSGALPLGAAARLPTPAQRFRSLKSEIDRTRPVVEDARRQSDLLNAEAAALRRRLEDTTERLQALESEKGRIDAELARLAPEEQRLAANFRGNRLKVSRLLAILERLQSDMPPVIALRSDDALSAARSAMILGAALPRIYRAAAALAHALDDLRRERALLDARRRDGARVGAQLVVARADLDQLLASKAQKALAATARYDDLEAQLEAAARSASDLQSLLTKVAALRRRPVGQGIVVVAAANTARSGGLRHGSLVKPVQGAVVAGGPHSPGLTILAPPGAKVVAPGDGEVLFAGPYHLEGKVLILDSGGGYDLVLAGLDAVGVRPGDELLAGEPVGAMPRAGAKLYFELRQNGKGVDPAPWMQSDPRKVKRS